MSLSSVDENLAMDGNALEEGAPPKGAPPASSANGSTGVVGDNGGMSRKLSHVSAQYDRSGKGYLDDAEMKMRELDSSNRGYLPNDRVYDLVKESIEMQKKMVTQKRMIVGLAVFAVILALANMGTAFAAATLAKDTTVTPDGDLAATNGEGERVSTTAKGKTYLLDSGAKEDADRRRLAVYNVTSYTTIARQSAEDMWTDWGDQSTSTVQLKWTCGLGPQPMGSTVVQPVVSGAMSTYNDDTNGTIYEYGVVISEVSYAVSFDCQDGALTCRVTGTNCCVQSGECVEGNKCLACGCRCVPNNSPEPRCMSYCDGDFGLALGSI